MERHYAHTYTVLARHSFSGTRVWLLTSLEANIFSSGRHWPSRAVSFTEKRSLQQQTTASSMEQHPATLERSSTVYRAVSSDKQLGRYLKNGVLITEVKAISLRLGPNGNGTEIHRWCAGDRTVNGRARVPFTRNGTERKRHCFMVPTVETS